MIGRRTIHVTAALAMAALAAPTPRAELKDSIPLGFPYQDYIKGVSNVRTKLTRKERRLAAQKKRRHKKG